jgi:hypothetical protein
MGLIPQSTVLSEASPESLTELFSRDPFSFSRLDRDRGVAALRAQRAKWEQSELAGPKPKATKATSKTLESGASVEDLGL